MARGLWLAARSFASHLAAGMLLFPMRMCGTKRVQVVLYRVVSDSTGRGVPQKKNETRRHLVAFLCQKQKVMVIHLISQIHSSRTRVDCTTTTLSLPIELQGTLLILLFTACQLEG